MKSYAALFVYFVIRKWCKNMVEFFKSVVFFSCEAIHPITQHLFRSEKNKGFYFFFFNLVTCYERR